MPLMSQFVLFNAIFNALQSFLIFIQLRSGPTKPYNLLQKINVKMSKQYPVLTFQRESSLITIRPGLTVNEFVPCNLCLANRGQSNVLFRSWRIRVFGIYIFVYFVSFILCQCHTNFLRINKTVSYCNNLNPASAAVKVK